MSNAAHHPPRVSRWAASGRALLPGKAEGVALVLDRPLSFWGGFDPEMGTISDRRHPQMGVSVAASILVMPSGRGSSSSSSVLAESLRAGTGPAGIVLLEADEILLVGALVVQMLDERTMPIVRVERRDYERLATGDHVSIAPDGRITVRPAVKTKRPLRRGVAALSRPDPAT